MKNTITFTTPAIFGLATVLAHMHTIDCAVDKDSKVIWTDNLDAFKEAFDNGGIDPEEFIVNEGIKSEYTKLKNKLDAEAALLVAAQADEDGEDGDNEPSIEE